MGPRVLTWDVGQLHEPCLLLVLPAERRVQGPAPREVLGHTAGGGVAQSVRWVWGGLPAF